MGKNKNKANKNVFKVAGSRSQKAKSKAKKVKTTLKKLDLGQGGKLNKEKTNLINKQLAELSKEVRRTEKKMDNDTKGKTVVPIKSNKPLSTASKEQATNLIQNLQL